VEFDERNWEVAHALPHGMLYWIRPGIVAAVPDDGVVETPDLSAKVYAGYTRCAEERGHPIAIVVLVDQLGNQTPEVRAYWQKAMKTDVLACAALVSTSFFARAISSFFIGIRKPAVPTQVFGSLEQAVEWAEAFLPEDVARPGAADRKHV